MSAYDPKLLEAWFRFLAEAARSSGKSSELLDAMNRREPAPDHLAALMKEFSPGAVSTSTPEAISKAVERWSEALGFVPRARYDALKEQYEELKERLEEAERQARTARRLMSDPDREAEAQEVLDAWSRTLAETLEVQAQWWSSFFPSEPPDPED